MLSYQKITKLFLDKQSMVSWIFMLFILNLKITKMDNLNYLLKKSGKIQINQLFF